MTVEEIVPAFLTACPGLPAIRQGRLLLWGDRKPNGRYDDLVEIACYLVDCQAAGERSELGAGFAVLERCFEEGTGDAQREAAALLRLLQDFAQDRPFGDEALMPWLGPCSRVVWQQLWILQGELSQWLGENLPYLNDDDDDQDSD